MQDEIRLYCSGTATPASKLVPYAIGMVNRLREVDSFGSKQAVGDNWWIDVKINNGHAMIVIWEDGEVDADPPCLPYQSGMAALGVSVFRYDPDTGNKIPGSYAFQPSAAYASRRKLPMGWQVGARAAGGNSLSLPPFEVSNQVATQVLPPWRLDGWNQTSYLKPGMFSGYMRYVVQVLLGMDAQVRYDYRFIRTHGIFRIMKGKRQADWLIEISQKNGVMAMRMPACYSAIPKENHLGYVPKGDSFPTNDTKLAEAIKSGKVKVLMPASALEQVYSKTAFSPVYGWAFDYTGGQASIVVSTRLPGDDYMTTYLYTVSIGAGMDGQLSASLSMDESGRTVGAGYAPNTYGKASFKIPLEVGGLAWPVDFGPPPGVDYVAQDCIAPLYVFYTTAGVRKVLRYRNSVPTYGRPADEHRRPTTTGDPFSHVDDMQWISNDNGLGEDFIEYQAGPSGNAWSRVDQGVYLDDVAPGRDSSLPLRNEYRADASGSVIVFSTFGDYSNPYGGYYYANIYVLKRIRSRRITKDGVVESYRSSAVIPCFEREAVAIHICRDTYYGYRTEAFWTNDATGAAASMRAKIPPADENTQFREDGLPLDITFTVGENAELTSDAHYVGDAGGNTGPMIGTIGGFSGKFGSTSVPASFTTPGGLNLTNSGDAFVGTAPNEGVVTTYNKYARSAIKKVITSSGSFSLVQKSGDNADSFSERDSTYPPDPAWFSNDPYAPARYVMIATWNGAKRYSPSDLNLYDFDNSALGEYKKPPKEGNESLINFVGDA